MSVCVLIEREDAPDAEWTATCLEIDLKVTANDLRHAYEQLLWKLRGAMFQEGAGPTSPAEAWSRFSALLKKGTASGEALPTDQSRVRQGAVLLRWSPPSNFDVIWSAWV